MPKLNTEKNRTEWVIMNMRLRGSGLTPREIRDVMSGRLIPEARVMECITIEKLSGILSHMDILLGLQEEMSEETLKKLYRRLSGKKTAEYRKVTPVLYNLSYNPVLPQEIEEEIRALFRGVSVSRDMDPVKKAALIHNDLIRIYPFDRWNEELARAAMEYVLAWYGKPFCSLTLSEREYNEALVAYLRGGDSGALCAELRMDLLMAEGR